MRGLLALLLAAMASGCGIAVQSIIGWNDTSTNRRITTHEVRIESEPEGAQVSRGDDQSVPKILGTTPFVDRVDYEIEETVESPKAWGLLGTGIGEVALGAILAGVGKATQTENCVIGGDSDFDCDSRGGTALFIVGGTMLTFGVVDAIWGLIRLFQSDSITASKPVEQSLTYAVEKDGVTKSAVVAIPTAGGAKIDLGTGAIVEVQPPPPPPPAEAPADSRIVAVMDVEDANQGVKGATDQNLIHNLSDQLRIFVAQQGVRTIDRTSQDQALRTQIQAIKTDSYQSCYDDSCQIELGKALAASHILRSKITKFGAKCVLNGELIDLAREVTIKAASAQGTCQAEGFLEMSEAIARDLMKQ